MHKEKTTIGHFNVKVDGQGVALVTFSRPPVNAISLSVYEDIGALVDYFEESISIRVVILTAAQDSNCWCGGADLKDF